MSGLGIRRRKKNGRQVLASPTQLQNRPFHVVDWAVKCTKTKTSRKKRAKLLLCTLSMKICDDLVAVLVVVVASAPYREWRNFLAGRSELVETGEEIQF